MSQCSPGHEEPKPKSTSWAYPSPRMVPWSWAVGQDGIAGFKLGPNPKYKM